MTPRPRISAQILLVGSLLATALAIAAESPTPRDETLTLSPFVVETDRDTGYAASSTLAGTRLNTPVRDLGTSISIYTKDFLNDIGATNVNDLLVYATGMEAAGAQGNFSGVVSDINTDRVVGESARSSPQSGTRTRGLAAPNFTRGFFATAIPFDSYNSSTVTVNRGPNAILFGVGSPAGVVDASPVRPDLNRNQGRTEVRFGNNVSARGAVDLNQVIVPRQLAIRMAALEDRDQFNQRPAYEEKRRAYGALTYEPFRSTSVRASFESGLTRANRPISVLPWNSISRQWYDAGQPTWDWSFYDDPALNPAAAAQNAGNFVNPLIGTETRSDQISVFYSQRGAKPPGRRLTFAMISRNCRPSSGPGSADIH